MKILIVPDSFKGSLSSKTAGKSIKQGFSRIFPQAEYKVLPMADGGEGSVAAILEAVEGRLYTETVTGPNGAKTHASYAILADGTAVIEMAAASGLTLVGPAERNPANATTYGTGELMLSALDNGAKRIFMCIGGSATNDGGAGMASALGIRFFDQEGKTLPAGGSQLLNLYHINASKLDTRIRKTEIVAACDVINPLCGENGASYVFGPQKGATPEMVRELDSALLHYAGQIDEYAGFSVSSLPGAGAAGGLGAGLVAFCGAELRSGVDEIMAIMGLEDEIASSDFILTGEGQVDRTSALGKLVSGLGKRAQKYKKPLLVFTGSLGDGYKSVYDAGVSSVIPISSSPMSYEYAVQHADTLLQDAAERTARLIQIGR